MASLAPLSFPAQPTMSSRDIADICEARHNDVVSTIRRLFAKGVLRESRKTTRELRVASGGRPTSVFDLTKRDTLVVVSGYNDDVRARIVDRWMELEAASAASPSVLDADTRAVIGGIVKGIIHKEIAAVLPDLIQAELAGARHRLVVDNVTVGEILDQLGVKSKGRRPLVNLVAARLRRFSDGEGIIPRRTSNGRSASSLYPPELVLRWLAIEGKDLVAAFNAGRQSQADLFRTVRT